MPTNNNDRPNTAQGNGKIKPKKKKVVAPTVTPGAAYDWGDGKGRAHSISVAQHKKNVDAKALQPYDIGGGYDPAQVRTTVNSAADLEYGRPIQTQQTQIDNSQTRSDVDIPGWYQTYIDAIGKARAQTADIYAKAAGSSGATPAAATGDQVGDLAAANRTAMQNSFQGLVKSQGANTEAGYVNQGVNAQLLKTGSLTDEARNRQTLMDQLGQLQQEKGEYANTALQKMREGAQSHDADMAAAHAAEVAATGKIDFDNNGIADSVDAANARYGAQATAADNKITKWGFTVGEWRDMKPEERTAEMKRQEKPKSKTPNTKDYYGHSWAQWQKMGPGARRKAMKLAADATRAPSSGDGPTRVQADSAKSQFRFALDWYRQHPGGTVNAMTATGTELSTPVDYEVARIMDHWAKNKGKITADEYNTLRSRGVPEAWLVGHVG